MVNTGNLRQNACYPPSTTFPIMGTVLPAIEKKQAFNTVYNYIYRLFITR